MKTYLITTGMSFALAAVLLTGSGCFTRHPITQQRSASVVQYLFPRDSHPLVHTGIPHLRLPVRAGIAFVPFGNYQGPHFPHADEPVSDVQKMKLLEDVSSQFKKYAFIKVIEPVPPAYLRAGGSFENLEQIRRMFDLDVMVLLSYDQMQFTDKDVATLAYWTLFGAYIIEGEKNDTQTMLDAVVYDIGTRTLLFRAPGVSHLKGRSTPVNLSEELRMDRVKGFELAAKDLAVNLEAELAEFQKKVKDRPEEYKVVKSPGYTGAGSIDVIGSVILLVMVTFFFGLRGPGPQSKRARLIRPVLMRDAKQIGRLGGKRKVSHA